MSSKIAVEVLSWVGEKAGKAAIEQILNEYGGESSQVWKNLLLGESIDITKIQQHLNRLEEQIAEIKGLVEKVREGQIFTRYDDAISKINVLLSEYNSWKEESLAVKDDKIQAYINIFAEKGIMYQVRSMLTQLSQQVTHAKKSLLEEYVEFLADKYTDVFEFCNKLDAVVEHFKFYLIQATSLSELLRKEAEEYNNKRSPSQKEILIKEVRITKEDSRKFDEYYHELSKLPKKLRDTFDTCNGVTIMLQHVVSGKYLTGYKEGVAQSKYEPFGSYDSGGMPQVFVNELSNGKVKYYTKIGTVGSGQFTSSTSTRYEVQIDGKSQKWKLIKKNENGQTYFIFQHLKSGLALDGINKGRVYLSARNDDNSHLRWQPILITNKSGSYEDGCFLLRHMKQGFALDSDGTRAYAEDRKPDYGNINMKWRLVTDTLFPGEFLEPGQKLLSMNGKISFTYDNNGALVIRKQGATEPLWDSQPKRSDAGQCRMQEDGNFVAYAKDGTVTFASHTIKPKEDQCRLILQDGGNLVIVDKNGTQIWSNK